MSQQMQPLSLFSRRKLIGSAGVALAAGATAPAEEARQTATRTVPRSPTEWLPKQVRRGGDQSRIVGAPSGGQHHLTSFISSEAGLTAARFEHKKGWAVQIKPSGYRGVPIYTIHDLRMSVDGRAIEPNTVIFVYNNTSYRLNQLKDLMGMQWWVFDWATLFVPGEMTPGEHEVEVRMKYANTYVLGEAEMGEKLRLTYQEDEVALLCL
jgi:hypothetical protein